MTAQHLRRKASNHPGARALGLTDAMVPPRLFLLGLYNPVWPPGFDLLCCALCAGAVAGATGAVESSRLFSSGVIINM
jgi:hypothetical protein